MLISKRYCVHMNVQFYCEFHAHTVCMVIEHMHCNLYTQCTLRHVNTVVRCIQGQLLQSNNNDFFSTPTLTHKPHILNCFSVVTKYVAMVETLGHSEK